MRKLMVLSGVLVFTACGLDHSMGTNPTASAYDRAALQVSNSAAGYQTATTNMGSPTDCADALQKYAGQVGPMLDRMKDMAGQMDDMMNGMGHTTDADAQCGMQVMMQEFQHHVGAACSSSDMTANEAEVQRHVQAMQQYTNHMRMRADEINTMMPGGIMGGMMNSGGMMGGGGTGTMDAGTTGGTGTTTGSPGSGTGGGWMMPDGGMMSWAEPMPGCSYTGNGYQPAGG